MIPTNLQWVMEKEMIKRSIWLQHVGLIFHQIMQEFTSVRLTGRGSIVIVHRPATWMRKAMVDTSTSQRNIAHFQYWCVESKT